MSQSCLSLVSTRLLRENAIVAGAALGLEFLVLGPLEVRDGGTVIAVGGARQRALLALLLLNANRVVPKDRLIDELSLGSAEGGGDHKLRGQISRLRAALARCRCGEARLQTRAPGYMLRVDPG